MTGLTGVVLRTANRTDISALSTLEAACFADAWKEEQIESALNRVGFSGVVAEENGEIVGYAFLSVLFETAELDRIAVKAAHRNRGLGGEILDECIKRAKSLKAERMLLEVRESNTKAIRLYESRNFISFHIRKGYYAGVENAVEMQRDLTEK